MTDHKGPLTHSATKLRPGATDVAEELQKGARTAWNSVQQQTTRVASEGSAYVRENPVSTALAAFGLGLLLGLLVGRRPPASFKERFVAEPLHQSRGLLLGLLLAGVSVLRRTISSGSRLIYLLTCKGQ